MPPASLSTLEVMMPGPMTARKRVIRRRQFLPREKNVKVRARMRSMVLLMRATFMGGELEKRKRKFHRRGHGEHRETQENDVKPSLQRRKELRGKKKRKTQHHTPT